MESCLEMRLVVGAYDKLVNGELDMELVGGVSVGSGSGSGEQEEEGVDSNPMEAVKDSGKRVRVAGGKYWDVILHVLPKGA